MSTHDSASPDDGWSHPTHATCRVCSALVDAESGRCYACGFSRRELEGWRRRHADAWRLLVAGMWRHVGLFWGATVLLALWFTGLASLAQVPGWIAPEALQVLVFWALPLSGIALLLWSTMRMDHLIRRFPGWVSPAAAGIGRSVRGGMRVRRRPHIPARTRWFPGAAVGGAVLVTALVAEGALEDFGRGIVCAAAGLAFIAAAARVATLQERMESWRALLDDRIDRPRVVSRSAAVWIIWCVLAILLAFTVAWCRLRPAWRGEIDAIADALAMICAVIAMFVWAISYRGAAKELGRWLR